MPFERNECGIAAGWRRAAVLLAFVVAVGCGDGEAPLAAPPVVNTEVAGNYRATTVNATPLGSTAELELVDDVGAVAIRFDLDSVVRLALHEPRLIPEAGALLRGRYRVAGSIVNFTFPDRDGAALAVPVAGELRLFFQDPFEWPGFLRPIRGTFVPVPTEEGSLGDYEAVEYSVTNLSRGTRAGLAAGARLGFTLSADGSLRRVLALPANPSEGFPGDVQDEVRPFDWVGDLLVETRLDGERPAHRVFRTSPSVDGLELSSHTLDAGTRVRIDMRWVRDAPGGPEAVAGVYAATAFFRTGTAPEASQDFLAIGGRFELALSSDGTATLDVLIPGGGAQGQDLADTLSTTYVLTGAFIVLGDVERQEFRWLSGISLRFFGRSSRMLAGTAPVDASARIVLILQAGS